MLSYQILEKYNIDTSILNLYNEPHRFYHNIEHIENMLEKAIPFNDDELNLAIIFHDIIYDPKSNDNELKSAEVFKYFFDNEKIYQAIVDTKYHQATNDISTLLIELDLYNLYNYMSDFIDFEHKIFKEYQYADLDVYIEKRCEILKKYNVSSDKIDYIKKRKYNIGLYAGTFNPFHVGHYNILQKSEKIFDKVIIGYGHNTEKEYNKPNIPKILEYHQHIHYEGLLIDIIKDYTLIRGLRNSNDFNCEYTQYNFLKDIKSDIKVIRVCFN